jgi:hypothetical protein
MLNWFNKKLAPAPVVIEPTKTVVTPLPPPSDPVAYKVGKTEGGKITLQLGNGYSSGTLTMSNRGVLKLIDMLEAALEDEAFAPEGHDGRGPG